jgi:hypothetical protein
LWSIWIERNDKGFNQEQQHVSKVKHRIWDEVIIYAKAAWNQVVKQIKISSFSAEAMLQGFDKIGVLGMCFVEDTICILSGAGRGNLGK